MKKLLVCGVSLALLLAPVAPASANPTLPAGDVLYEMSCDNRLNDYLFHALNTTINTRTAIGNGTGVNVVTECAYQGALLPGTDWFYFPDPYEDKLVRVDVTTGLAEVVGLLRVSGSARGIFSIAIDDNGNAYALSYDELYSVNLNTGNLTTLVSLTIPGLDGGYFYGFAYDPKTEEFYVAEDSGGALHSLDMSTGVLTLLGNNSDYWVASMAFDSDGNLWVNGDGNQVSRVALSGFADSANWVDSAPLTPQVYSTSLVVRRASSDDEDESLANTGSAEATPYLLGGLLAAGIALALRRRRV